MGPTNGESFATQRRKTAISKPSWCILGRNIFANMRARFSRIVRWRSASEVAREASPRSGTSSPQDNATVVSLGGDDQWTRCVFYCAPQRAAGPAGSYAGALESAEVMNF